MNDTNKIKAKELDHRNASAAIILDFQNNYLLQLRDSIEGIFYPNHWGLFGGALEFNEDPVEGLRREINEELSLTIDKFTFFTDFKYNLSQISKDLVTTRSYFVARIDKFQINEIQLMEGQKFEFFNYENFNKINNKVPYDAFAIYLHANYLINN